MAEGEPVLPWLTVSDWGCWKMVEGGGPPVALGCLQSRRGAEGTLVQGCPLSKACLSSQILTTDPGVTSDVPSNL